MISEHQFASEFTGFWAEVLPFLTPQAIAKLNVNASAIGRGRQCWSSPLAQSADNSNNDIIAEAAFELFAASLNQGKSVAELSRNAALIRSLEAVAIERISALRRESKRRQHSRYTNTAESVEIASRLQTYFDKLGPVSIKLQPRFKGCGILDSCYGDVLAGKTLFELKTVDRNLRSADIRQLLIYCALNQHSVQYEIERVAIVNPRRGVDFSFSVEELAERAAGKTPAELFHQITSFLADFESHQPL